MKASQFLFATLKETPSDADIASSQLMVRAGLIRKIASGLYIWLPMGLRVLQKVERIVREEMQNVGAQEVLMPMTQPAELWQMTGRFDDYGPELLRFKDPHARDFVFGRRTQKSSPILPKVSCAVISSCRLPFSKSKVSSVMRFVRVLA